MRPRKERSRASSGSQNCFDQFMEGLVDQKKERKILIGYWMRICKCSARSSDCTDLENPSDGATPEQKTKQILAIAPILRGQSHNEQNKTSPLHQSQDTSQQSHQQTAGHEDLIDFGQSNTAPVTSAPAGQTDPMHFQPNAPPGMQAPLQPGQPIKRVDTKTRDLDEFVDAPGY